MGRSGAVKSLCTNKVDLTDFITAVVLCVVKSVISVLWKDVAGAENIFVLEFVVIPSFMYLDTDSENIFPY